MHTTTLCCSSASGGGSSSPPSHSGFIDDKRQIASMLFSEKDSERLGVAIRTVDGGRFRFELSSDAIRRLITTGEAEVTVKITLTTVGLALLEEMGGAS